jgi:starch phosphorylase
LPLYAGGLGILAGDYLKTASDLGVPVVGVGLLYQVGYFRQMVDAGGRQQEMYPYNDPASLPIRPVQAPAGGWLHVPLDLPGRTILLRVWQAQVGRALLYLLDSNDPLNSPVDRHHQQPVRRRPRAALMQEMVLGISGWRALEAVSSTSMSAISTKGMPPLRSWSALADSWKSGRYRSEEAFRATRAQPLYDSHVGSCRLR